MPDSRLCACKATAILRYRVLDRKLGPRDVFACSSPQHQEQARTSGVVLDVESLVAGKVTRRVPDA
jgi:hypothetical protein